MTFREAVVAFAEADVELTEYRVCSSVRGSKIEFQFNAAQLHMLPTFSGKLGLFRILKSVSTDVAFRIPTSSIRTDMCFF
jgi:hypothetical protein